MTPHREHVMRGTVVSEHRVQLFDEINSLVASVAAFLVDGWKRGDHLLVVARPGNWALTAAELEAAGCPVAELIASGHLVALDAATTLASFMVSGDPKGDAFDRTVGDTVRRLCAASAGLTVYGEMVDILVTQGNYHGAEQLEALWNQLAATCSFTLLCGYMATNFGDEKTAQHLQTICGQHTHSSAEPTDLLASWLLSNRRPRYHDNRQ